MPTDQVVLFHSDLLRSSNVSIYKWNRSIVKNIGNYSNGKVFIYCI